MSATVSGLTAIRNRVFGRIAKSTRSHAVRRYEKLFDLYLTKNKHTPAYFAGERECAFPQNHRSFGKSIIPLLLWCVNIIFIETGEVYGNSHY
jgi:hypothetical protein